MRLVQARNRNESISLRIALVRGSWAWTAFVVGQYETFNSDVVEGSSSEEEAIDGFLLQVGKLTRTAMSPEGRKVITRKMKVYLEEVRGSSRRMEK